MQGAVAGGDRSPGAGARAMTMMFQIIGHPRTKKTSQRIVRAGGRPRIIPSKETAEWSNHAILQLRSQLHRYRGNTFHDRQRWNLRAVFYRRQETTADLIGHLQALCDVLEAAEVVSNDRWIRGVDGSRLDVDQKNPRVEITLTEM